jgi:hypothetical protein
MQSLRCRPGQFAIIIAAFVLLLLLIAGCVISPRRIVNEGPSPTPTPDISPTPTPGITPTPTPTPTPTGMDKTVPKAAGEFLFLGDASAPLLTGFSINSDGSLAPIPGSPFTISAPARSLQSLNSLLIVKTDKTTLTFTVEKETGLLQQAASINTSIAGSDIAGPIPVQSAPAALDISGKFMYIADHNRAEVIAYRVDSGMLSALSVSYPVPTGTTSIVLVKP